MGNRHHAHVLNIDGGEVERVSGPGGKRYLCKTCGTDSCRHTKKAREIDALHLAAEKRLNPD